MNIEHTHWTLCLFILSDLSTVRKNKKKQEKSGKTKKKQTTRKAKTNQEKIKKNQEKPWKHTHWTLCLFILSDLSTVRKKQEKTGKVRKNQEETNNKKSQDKPRKIKKNQEKPWKPRKTKNWTLNSLTVTFKWFIYCQLFWLLFVFPVSWKMSPGFSTLCHLCCWDDSMSKWVWWVLVCLMSPSMFS